MPPTKKEKLKINLPVRPFLYTVDQIGTILALSDQQVKRWLWLRDRMPGPRPHDKLEAVNIAPEGEPPAWRIAENELIRFLSHQGIPVYDRSWR